MAGKGIDRRRSDPDPLCVSRHLQQGQPGWLEQQIIIYAHPIKAVLFGRWGQGTVGSYWFVGLKGDAYRVVGHAVGSLI